LIKLPKYGPNDGADDTATGVITKKSIAELQQCDYAKITETSTAATM
jgi:hypothetical protein